MACYRSATNCLGKCSRLPTFQSLPRSTRYVLTDRCAQNQYLERAAITACTGLRAVLRCKTSQQCTMLNRAAIYVMRKKFSSYSRLSARLIWKREKFNQYRLHISYGEKDFRLENHAMPVFHASFLQLSTLGSTYVQASPLGTSEFSPRPQQTLHSNSFEKSIGSPYVVSLTLTTENIVTKQIVSHYPNLVEKILRKACGNDTAVLVSGVNSPCRDPLPGKGNLEGAPSARRRIIRDAFEHLVKNHSRLANFIIVTSCTWKQSSYFRYDTSCSCKK